MKQVCLLCERTSVDNNLYCQEVFCPAEMSPFVLGYGEWLGDIEVVKPISILRSAVLYEARRRKQRVCIKVAHPGTENTERLKREAAFLQGIRLSKEPAAHLPVWLPPYVAATVDAETDAYGRAMLGGHLLYYSLFEHFDGESLRDVLTKHPQMWVNHVGWLMTDLSSAIAFLQSKGLLHYTLCPEAVLVRFDLDQNAPHILLADLGIVSHREQLAMHWYSFCTPPAYTAPELIGASSPQPHYAVDVYGLGLILYELLVGQPAFPYKLRSDDEVYQAVRDNQRVRMNRTEDVKPVADIALRATSSTSAARYQSAAEMAEQLLKYFSNAPKPKRRRGPSLNTILLLVFALLVVAFLITFVLTMGALAAAGSSLATLRSLG